MEGSGPSLKDLSEIVANFATAGALLVAGVWAYLNFGWRREAYPRVQLDVDVKYIGEDDSGIIVELISCIKNVGLVRHLIDQFNFNVFIFREGTEPAMGGDQINNQVIFESFAKNRSWMGTQYATFVDPDVEQYYRHVTLLPPDTTYILLKTTFIYPGQPGQSHSAQRAFDLSTLRS